MPDQTCQQAHTDAFVCQCGDEGASSAVTTATIDASTSIEIVKVLCQCVGCKALAWFGLRGEEGLIWFIPTLAGHVLR